jgi:hypothetical protein
MGGGGGGTQDGTAGPWAFRAINGRVGAALDSIARDAKMRGLLVRLLVVVLVAIAPRRAERAAGAEAGLEIPQLPSCEGLALLPSGARASLRNLLQLLHFKRRRRMELEHWIDFKDFVPDPKSDDEVADQVAWETPR